jgi:hypothetical protein
MASALGAMALAIVVDSHHLTGRGWTLALIRPRHLLRDATYPGQSPAPKVGS